MKTKFRMGNDIGSVPLKMSLNKTILLAIIIRQFLMCYLLASAFNKCLI